ncbi:S1 RNA-binding domain-containing protein [Micromonospora sp. NPDC048930]|uniref:S1 RNA-binding domain-containing protein n=1 Tax=Micromonospora sp. NPDC048930 TaxID=3364261 RepID=UPI00371B9803
MTSSAQPDPRDDAWARFRARHDVGDVVSVRVTRVVPFGALVELPGGIPGLLRTGDRPAAGARVAARVREFDGDRRRVSLVAA